MKRFWLIPCLLAVAGFTGLRMTGGSFAPVPPTPILITFSPTNPSIADNFVNGTQVASVLVTMSNGSVFNGSLGFSPPVTSGCAQNGNNAGLFGVAIPPTYAMLTTRTGSSADEGTKLATVTATQNGGTACAVVSVLVQPANAVPPPAAVAGFTTLIINDDFTSPSFANPATWLDCAGASSPLYWRAWDGFGPYPDCPISIVSDQGSNSVRIHWQDSYLGFLPGNNSPMQTTPDNASGRATPPGFYLEVVARTDNSGSGIHPWLALWSYSVHQGGTGAYEIDGFEEFQNGGGGGFAVHNFGAAASDQNCAGQYCGCADLANSCAGAFLDVTQYHKYAWRQTSAGSDIVFCTYISLDPNGAITNANLYGCGTIKPNAFQLSDNLGMVHQFSIGTTGTAGSAVGNGNGKNNLIKSIKVWSCAGINSGALCRSSSNNP